MKNNLSTKAGLPPGSLVHVGRRKVNKVSLELIDYDEKELVEKKLKNVEEAFPFKDMPTITWLNITGLHDTSVIEKIGKHFGLHPLIMEDILNTGQRPMIEDFENYLFLSMKMLYIDKKNEVSAEHVSLVIGSSFVLSFQEIEGDVFDPVRERINSSRWRIRKLGSDYLGYTLIDAIVDNYFIVLEKIGDHIEEIEDKLEKNPNPKILNSIRKLKNELVYLRKSVWPLREVIGKFHKMESDIIKQENKIYFSDLYDHTIQVIDTVESYRDIVSGMIDIYLSIASNKMNEIMKVLTIFAVIFIPLTFVAGIYGMNFEFMPELGWHYGYLFAWIVFVAVGGGMLLYFKKKKWL